MRPARIVPVLLVLLVAGLGSWAFLSRGKAPDPAPSPAERTPPPPAPPGDPVSFAIVGPIDDRLGPEPCSRLVGAGLWSFPAFVDAGRQRFPYTVPLSLGNVTAAPGIAGHRILGLAIEDVFAPGEVRSMVAGPYELRHGVEFARFALASPSFPVLCANAVDPEGAPILRPFAAMTAGNRTIVVCATVSPTFGPWLLERGSDVRLAPAEEALRRAVEMADTSLARVDRSPAIRVLLHHGTREEAEALVRAVPGFSFAVVADEPELPDEVRAPGESGVPVYATGRRFRFGLRVLVHPDGGVEATHVRIGVQIQEVGSPVEGAFRTFPAELDRVLAAERPGTGQPDRRRPRGALSFVGADTCARCHAEAAAAWRTSPHARPFAAFAPRPEDVSTAACLGCHTTGAFEQGGWTGKDDASDLGAVSCESCHGPGSAHAADPKPGYGRTTTATCGTCHSTDRSPQLDADATWKAHGHAIR